MSTIIGIDLGTTNSLVAVWQGGEARLIPNALGDTLTPSVVGVDDDGQILVGQAPQERLITHPSLTQATFKRYMGTNRELRLGKETYRAEELSSLVLRSLKADAEAFLGEAVSEAVISVPAYFNDTQRKATRLAGRMAGLKVERLINEPTAAALAYGLHQRDQERQFLVFDLGGGTFDVSLLDIFEGIMEVRASAGDNFLGGEDFNALIVQDALNALSGFTKKNISLKDLDPKERSQLMARAEAAKRSLTREKSVTFSFKHKGNTYPHTLTQASFATLCHPLLLRLRQPIERALRDARVRAADLHDVILVGGATRMAVIRQLAATLFGRLPAGHIDPDTVVALGAAVQAGLKARDSALDDVVLTDVSPYTLGTEIVKTLSNGSHQEGHYLPILERNTVIPASRMETVYPVHVNQRVIKVGVYQGESPRVVNNILLGELSVPIPTGETHERGVDIRFTYDIDGLLEVETTVQRTQLTRSLVIQGTPGAMSDAEISKRLEHLATLKLHPRELAENRALQATLERLYEESIGEARAMADSLLGRFQEALETQNPKLVESLRTQIEQYIGPDRGNPWGAN